MSSHLRQRQVADAIGVKPSTYGNIESSNHKVVRRERVVDLAKFYELDAGDSERLLAAWEQLPASEFNLRQAGRRRERSAFRVNAREAPKLRLALVEVLGVLLGVTDDPCACVPASEVAGDPRPPCEVCSALHVLGLSSWTSRDVVAEQLSALQDSMTTATDPVDTEK